MDDLALSINYDNSKTIKQESLENIQLYKKERKENNLNS
jgi:hypothetical protein